MIKITIVSKPDIADLLDVAEVLDCSPPISRPDTAEKKGSPVDLDDRRSGGPVIGGLGPAARRGGLALCCLRHPAKDDRFDNEDITWPQTSDDRVAAKALTGIRSPAHDAHGDEALAGVERDHHGGW